MFRKCCIRRSVFPVPPLFLEWVYDTLYILGIHEDAPSRRQELRHQHRQKVLCRPQLRLQLWTGSREAQLIRYFLIFACYLNIIQLGELFDNKYGKESY